MNNMVTLVRYLRASLAWAAVRMNEALIARELQPVAIRATQSPRLLRKITPVFALAVGLSALAGSASADSMRRAGDAWADGRLVDVQIQIDGQAAPLYWAPGRDDRRYLEALAGRNYSVVLRNNSARRVGVLIAVDGLNVVNGEISRLSNAEPMYVLGPWERTTIKGWRTNLESIRRFQFVDERRSYAERTGQANSDMGWIRVLAFREEQTWTERWHDVSGGRRNLDDRRYKDEAGGPRAAKPAPIEEDAPMADQELERGDDAPAPMAKRDAAGRSAQPNSSYAPEATSPQANSFPGTGWGDKKYDPVRRVDFRAERRATDHLIMRYEYATALRALGIFPDRDRLWERDGDLGFAKPPRH